MNVFFSRRSKIKSVVAATKLALKILIAMITIVETLQRYLLEVGHVGTVNQHPRASVVRGVIKKTDKKAACAHKALIRNTPKVATNDFRKVFPAT